MAGRTFQPEDRIAHYRVVGPLGTGGMGEVYIAQDERLERSVALKVLPPELVRNEEKVRRFVTEAKSASSLSHPNIVTIYEIGEDRVQPASGDGVESGTDAVPDGGPIHYITMELVQGETLDRKIHSQQADMRTLIGYIAQAAEGVAKAHAAGVVHRDLKPSNIMVSRDGFAKVLDFGLAKLIESEGVKLEDRTSAPTATRAGMVMGTVGYMSPEQVQGKSADHRSDVFSMGVILYEAATRRRPFVADSDVEVMHQILRDSPPRIAELNPDAPAALRRLIRRCMAKDPDHRLGSMRDLALELRQIVDEWDSLNVTTSGSTSISGPATVGRRTRRGLPPGLIAAVAALGIAGLALGLYAIITHDTAPGAASASSQAPQVSSIMSRGADLGEAVLSSDGRYLAYVTAHGNLTDLMVRQVRTGSDVTIVAGSPVPIKGIRFSPDSDYLYFLNRDPDSPNYSALFQVASLGGTPRKVLFDVDSAPTFSPDGSRVCFRRGLLQENVETLMIADLGTGEARELTRVDMPSQFVAGPVWSPDGATVAAAVQTSSGGVRAWLETVDVDSGRRSRLNDDGWLQCDSLAWLPGGGELVASALDFSAGTEPQLYRVSFPGGDVQRITSDLDGYRRVSASANADAITAVRRSTVSNLWVAGMDRGGEANSLTYATGSAASMGQIAPLPGGSVAYTAPRDNRFFVWRTNADGSGQRQITDQGVWVIALHWSAAAGIAFTQVEGTDPVVAHVWTMRADGTGLERRTDGQGEELAALSPTGDLLLFRRWTDPRQIRALALDEAAAEPYLLAGGTVGQPLFSPDGRRVLLGSFERDAGGRLYPVHEIVPVEGGEPVARFRLPPAAFDLRWTPDGEAVSFIDQQRGWNVMRKALPDGATEAVTSFTEGQVMHHAWNHDGSRLALHRQFGERQTLWRIDGAASEPALVTDYRTGILDRLHWAPDAPLLYYVYSTVSQDVVLMTGIR